MELFRGVLLTILHAASPVNSSKAAWFVFSDTCCHAACRIVCRSLQKELVLCTWPDWMQFMWNEMVRNHGSKWDKTKTIRIELRYTEWTLNLYKDFYISGDRMPNTLSSDGKYFRWEPKQQEQQEQQHWAHPQKDKQLHYDWRVALMFCLKQGWLLCFFCKWLVTVIQDVHLLHFFILIQELQSIVCSMSSMVFKLYSSSVVK